MEIFLKDLQASLNPTEDEINKYYQEHKQDFTNPVAIVVKHILLQSKEDAAKALERLKNKESFDKVAQEMSTDRISAQKGGLIGPFKKGELIPAFEEVAFKLNKGEISDIVETTFGFHIITKVSDQALPEVSEEVAKDEIKRILEKQKIEDWFENTKKKLNVTVDYDKLNSIQEEQPEQQEEQNSLNNFDVE
jgi:parvulin-like peptidyl-prolyl isomerase